MDWAINITANGLEDLETELPELIASIVTAGGWIMRSAISNKGAVRVHFEFERRACVQIYTALMESGLELSPSSHLQLAQLCHCSASLINKSRIEYGSGILNSGTVLVEMSLLSSQIENFAQMPEKSAAADAVFGNATS